MQYPSALLSLHYVLWLAAPVSQLLALLQMQFPATEQHAQSATARLTTVLVDKAELKRTLVDVA